MSPLLNYGKKTKVVQQLIGEYKGSVPSAKIIQHSLFTLHNKSAFATGCEISIIHFAPKLLLFSTKNMNYFQL